MPSYHEPRQQTQLISVGARSSALSRVQTEEVLAELRAHHAQVEFACDFMETHGDIDQETSLRSLGKTDFFTRSIDYAQAEGRFRIAIHSAKDLAEKLHPELTMVALTKGLDPSDALVLPQGETVESMPQGSVIASSSERREEAVRKLRPDFTFTDVRGTIEKRIQLMEDGHVDGLVVAEAALLRLGLTKVNRVILPGETTEFQGQLAILARKDDDEMARLFACIDSRP